MIQSQKTESIHLTDQMTVETLIALGIQRINETVAAHPVAYVGCGLSGGNDSVAAATLAFQSERFGSMLHIATGVGLQATEDHVKALCQQMGWPLEIYRAMENRKRDGTPDPMDYFDLVERFGFPGPSQHRRMYIKLKQRQLGAFCRDHKKFRSREVVVVVSGARRQESKRRGSVLGSDVTLTRRDDSYSILWCNPLFDASKLDCARIIEHLGIPKSPVHALIHKSGECLCGCYRKERELEETTLWFPEDPTVKRLNELHNRKVAAGEPGWGGPRRKEACKLTPTGPMCSSCDAAYADRALDASDRALIDAAVQGHFKKN